MEDLEKLLDLDLLDEDNESEKEDHSEKNENFFESYTVERMKAKEYINLVTGYAKGIDRVLVLLLASAGILALLYIVHLQVNFVMIMFSFVLLFFMFLFLGLALLSGFKIIHRNFSMISRYRIFNLSIVPAILNTIAIAWIILVMVGITIHNGIFSYLHSGLHVNNPIVEFFDKDVEERTISIERIENEKEYGVFNAIKDTFAGELRNERYITKSQIAFFNDLNSYLEDNVIVGSGVEPSFSRIFRNLKTISNEEVITPLLVQITDGVLLSSAIKTNNETYNFFPNDFVQLIEEGEVYFVNMLKSTNVEIQNSNEKMQELYTIYTRIGEELELSPNLYSAITIVKEDYIEDPYFSDYIDLIYDSIAKKELSFSEFIVDIGNTSKYYNQPLRDRLIDIEDYKKIKNYSELFEQKADLKNDEYRIKHAKNLTRLYFNTFLSLLVMVAMYLPTRSYTKKLKIIDNLPSGVIDNKYIPLDVEEELIDELADKRLH